MSKISIAIKTPKTGMKPSSPEVQFLKSWAGLSTAEAISCLEIGKSRPIYRAELFLNDHVDVDDDIRGILEGLHNLKLVPYILEIMYNENWDDIVDESQAEISEQVLLNVLDASKGRYI